MQDEYTLCFADVFVIRSFIIKVHDASHSLSLPINPSMVSVALYLSFPNRAALTPFRLLFNSYIFSFIFMYPDLLAIKNKTLLL